MNILLINPNLNKSKSKISSFFPSGILYLASYLKKHGFNVKIIDFQTITHQDLKANGVAFYLQEATKDFPPALVALGCLFSHYFPSINEIVDQLQVVLPEALVAIGGLHPTLFPKQIMERLPSIDYIVLGEAEISFLELCQKIKKEDTNFKSVDGLAYRDNQTMMLNPKTQFINNLDELPFPAFDKINIDNYVYHLRYNKNNRGMSIITSRSCPNRCTFCSMFHSHGYKWRARTPENVLNEMEHLYYKYDIRNFQFMDDNMSFNKKRTMAIFQGVQNRNLKITYNFPNGIAIKTLDREVIKLMKETGCLEIRLPIEHGSEYIRNEVMKKRLSTEQIFKVIELCNEFEIPTVGYFIIGMPGETHETLAENLNFIRKLKGNHFVDFMAANFATPYPGTELFRQCTEQGLLDQDKIAGLIDGTLTIFDTPIIKLKNVMEEDLIKARRDIWRVSFRQNLFKICIRYLKPTRNNFQIYRAIIHRFVFGY